MNFFIFLFAFSFFYVENSFSQQNYFNVPSFIPTPKNKLFFQEQFNVFDSIESNSTFDWGLGNNSEIGINIYGVKFNNSLTRNALDDDNDNKFRQMGLINFLWAKNLNEYHSLAFGHQSGLRFCHNNSEKYATMTYASYNYKNHDKSRFTIGPWFANAAYTKESNAFGIQAGLEYQLYKDELYFVADSISDETPMSVTVLGVLWEKIPHWPLSFGLQIPNAIKAGEAFVVEITHNPPPTP